MSTQTETLDTNRRLGIGSYDSEESIRDISREDYASQALRLWSHRQKPLGIDHVYTCQVEQDMADIHEDTIDLRKEYQWLTCYVWLHEEYDVAEIDPDTILLNGKIGAAWFQVKDEVQMLIAKFSWSQVEKLLELSEVKFTISGELYNGISFEGSDTVTVIDEEEEE